MIKIRFLEDGMFFLKGFLKKDEVAIDKNKLPVHIAIIPDGNGRWASKKGMPRSAGHREGSNTLKEIVKFSAEIGIKYLTVYAFSTENWRRPKDEVDALMDLLQEFLSKAQQELAGSNISIKVIGDRTRLSEKLREEIYKVEDLTKDDTGLQLNIALNYGGRDEILLAVKQVLKDVEDKKIEVDDIDISTISDRLCTADIPDPDLIIRSAGERRMSNFLLWQSAYSEFWYCNELWPDFSKKDLAEAIKDYQKRKRRYGGI